MFLFQRPMLATINDFLHGQASRPLSYSPAGITLSGQVPTGFVRDRSRVRLGCGAATFDRAKQALTRWEQFRLGWVEPFPGDTRLQVGQCVAVLAHALCLWTINACRIVAIIAEPRRFGFAYGTLPGHVERGEELFLIELDEQDDVWYEIVAISRPRHWLARLGYPYTRHVQAYFRRDSSAAMQRAVT